MKRVNYIFGKFQSQPTTIFCQIDDFCKDFDNYVEGKLLAAPYIVDVDTGVRNFKTSSGSLFSQCSTSSPSCF